MFHKLKKRGFDTATAHNVSRFFGQHIPIIRDNNGKRVDPHAKIRPTAENVADDAPEEIILQIAELGRIGVSYEIHKLDFIKDYGK